MKQALDVPYPQAEKIIVVLDNLNPHILSVFYETSEPREAGRLVERSEFHFTPKHNSWLAEIERSALVRKCLDRRILDTQTLTHEVQAWQQQHNDEVVKMLWHFSATAAIGRNRLRNTVFFNSFAFRSFTSTVMVKWFCPSQIHLTICMALGFEFFDHISEINSLSSSFLPTTKLVSHLKSQRNLYQQGEITTNNTMQIVWEKHLG